MKEKVCAIVSRIMQVPVEQVDEHSSPGTIQQWDSLRHMSLLLALEEEFGIQFEDQELVETMGISNILKVLERHVKHL